MSDHVSRARMPISQDLLAALTLRPWQAFLVRLATLVGMGKRLTDYFQGRALVAHVRRRFNEDFRRRWEEAERKVEDEILYGTGFNIPMGILDNRDDRALNAYQEDEEVDHD